MTRQTTKPPVMFDRVFGDGHDRVALTRHPSSVQAFYESRSGHPGPGGLRQHHAVGHHEPVGASWSTSGLRHLAHEVLPGRVRDLTDHEVRGVVAREIANGRLHKQELREPPRPVVSYDESLLPPVDYTPAAEEAATTWIGIRLKNPKGEPLPEENYVVIGADGRQWRGQLDADGHARVDGIARGPARVGFPDIDRGDWRLVGGGGLEENDDDLAIVGVRLVHATSGAGLGAVRLRLATDDGVSEFKATNPNGAVSLAGPPEARWSLELLDTKSVGRQLSGTVERDQTSAEEIGRGPVTELELRVRTGETARLDLGPPGEYLVRVDCLPAPAVAIRLVGLNFDVAKCLPLPGAIAGIRKLVEVYGDHPNAEVLVVGHTDTSGDDKYNRELSLERADAVGAYLRDDVEAWLPNYDASRAPEKRWGATEDAHMLSALPASGLRFARPGVVLTTAIREFQIAADVTVDGIAGPQTRRALIGAYMAQDGTSLPAETTLVAHGCGEAFPPRIAKRRLAQRGRSARRNLRFRRRHRSAAAQHHVDRRVQGVSGLVCESRAQHRRIGRRRSVGSARYSFARRRSATHRGGSLHASPRQRRGERTS